MFMSRRKMRAARYWGTLLSIGSACLVSCTSSREIANEDQFKIKAESISQNEAIQLAVEHIAEIGEGSSYDKDRPLGVSQTGNVVRVSFWAQTSPFYNPDETYATMVDVDLSTKELKTYAPQGFRRFPLGLILPFGYNERSEEEYQEYGDRLTTVLSTLGDQALQSGELPGIPEKSGSTISSTQAIEIADAVRKQGAYDKNTPPHVSLVNGVYVVTYWKPSDVLDTAWKRYAYRICIDAESGEYIGMDYSTLASQKSDHSVE